MDITSYLLGKKAGGGSGGSGHDWFAIGYSGEPQVIQDGYDYAKSIYDNWDTTKTNYSNLFANDKDLIYMPLVDTSNGTNFYQMFNACITLTTIPQLNTSNAKAFSSTFKSCGALKTVSQLDASKVTNVVSMFANCPSLTNLGGFKDLGKAYLTTAVANNSNYELAFNTTVLLTHDSLMNVINNLYDIATAGVQTQKLVLGADNLAKLTAEEIAIATEKGWTVS